MTAFTVRAAPPALPEFSPIVPSSHAQAEVGLIPEGWLNPQLQQIAENDSPICYGIVQVGPFTPNGIPVLAIKDLYFLDTDNIHYASTEIERAYSRSRVRPGDVLVSVKGTTGRVGLVPGYFQGNISRDLARIRPRAGIDSRFVYQMLQSELVQRRLATATVGTTRMELSIAVLKQVRIPLPPTRAEQEVIAEALSDVDGLLLALEALIAKKQAIKQSAMQQLLSGKTRLPGFIGEWETRRLGSVASIKTGSRNNEDKVADGQYPFFVRSDVVERINTYSYDCEAILVPGEGRIGSIFHYIRGRFDVHQRVYAITQFELNVSAEFVYFYMMKNFGAWAMQNTVRATVDSLRLPTFQNFEIRMPLTVDEQCAIAAVLSDMDAEIAALERRRDMTRAIKQGMMQQLLTGRVRLVSPAPAEAGA